MTSESSDGEECAEDSCCCCCWFPAAKVGEGVEGGLWEMSPGAEARVSCAVGGGGGGLLLSFVFSAKEAFGDSSSSASAAVPREKSSNEGVWVSLPPVFYVLEEPEVGRKEV